MLIMEVSNFMLKLMPFLASDSFFFQSVNALDAGNRANCIPGERFRSHWLGGWTGEVSHDNTLKY